MTTPDRDRLAPLRSMLDEFNPPGRNRNEALELSKGMNDKQLSLYQSVPSDEISDQAAFATFIRTLNDGAKIDVFQTDLASAGGNLALRKVLLDRAQNAGREFLDQNRPGTISK